MTLLPSLFDRDARATRPPQQRVGGRADRVLRIAHVTECYYPHLGGVCEHVHFFAAEARRRGHHVDVITSRMSGAVDEPGVLRVGRSQPIYANGSLARITVGLGLRRELRRVLRDGCYDVVHIHSPLTITLPLLAIEEADCPTIGTFHTYFERSLAYRALRGFLQRRLERLDAAIAVSPTAVQAYERYFGADWQIIPNGVDVGIFNPDAQRPEHLREDIPTVLFLGRFDPRNGLGTLIDAFRRIRRRPGERRLVVVGDGPLRDHYRRYAGDDTDIVFAGPVLDGRAGYYASSAVYACPTTKASFGITLLEAMACATPIVCSDIVGFRDVVSQGREAIMTPRGDRDALAGALLALFEDGGLRARLGATGRMRALAYAWPRVTDAILDVYERVLGARSAAA
jgi:phosphatidylinositol alpha-mannosyltransferase